MPEATATDNVLAVAGPQMGDDPDGDTIAPEPGSGQPVSADSAPAEVDLSADAAATKDDADAVDASAAGTAPDVDNDPAVGASAPEAVPAIETPPLDDAELQHYFELGRGALLEMTPASSIGSPAGARQESDGVVTVHFEVTMAGYPGWHWVASIARVDGFPPTVMETEMLPAEGALLAPEWIPWLDRLADYRATQEAAEIAAGLEAAALADVSELDLDDDEDGDDDFDDELDADEDDDLGDDETPTLLHAGDLDGVDIDDLDADDDDTDDDDTDDDDFDDDDDDAVVDIDDDDDDAADEGDPDEEDADDTDDADPVEEDTDDEDDPAGDDDTDDAVDAD